jgi:hypothetical protein
MVMRGQAKATAHHKGTEARRKAKGLRRKGAKGAKERKEKDKESDAMKSLMAVMIAVVALVGVRAEASEVLATTGTALRAPAVVTTATADLSTTFTLEDSATYVHLFADITMGGLSAVVLSPAGPMDRNGVAANYYTHQDEVTTITVSGRYHYRIPAKAFAGAKWGGVWSQGTGTAAGSSLALYYKIERE